MPVVAPVLQSPLAKKLRLKPDEPSLLLNVPENVQPLFGGQTGAPLTADDDICPFVLLFVLNREELAAWLPKIELLLVPDSVFWIAYPKKSGRIKSDITRDKGWEPVKAAGWEAVAQVAINETWSALRFRPAELVNSTRMKPAAAKELVVPTDLAEALAQHQVAQEFFNSLAYTYRKEYVRWLESAMRQDTRARRLKATMERLAAGLKLN